MSLIPRLTMDYDWPNDVRLMETVLLPWSVLAFSLVEARKSSDSLGIFTSPHVAKMGQGCGSTA
jgi:hypothetical protein